MLSILRARVSHAGIISNCVGALDGYLLSIVTPAKKHAKNVRSYFSGHYQKYGINIQACCDANALPLSFPWDWGAWCHQRLCCSQRLWP
jgi:hypothetical protein